MKLKISRYTYLLLNRVLLKLLLFLFSIGDLIADEATDEDVAVIGGLIKSGALGFNLEVGGCTLYR